MHAARLVGAEGFNRLVAAKRLHPQFTDDPEFVAMFHDEARIASMIHHPNVVPVLDVVLSENEVILVQEYVHGVPLSLLMKAAIADEMPIPVDIVVAILVGVLSGLHAAHEAKDELNEPLNIVHRDVSPQNVMVSVDGLPRLLDFGIAKARTSSHHTRDGFFKGKLSYMAPEQLRMEPITRRVDVYAAGVLMWELLANRKVNDGRSDADFVSMAMNREMPALSSILRESCGEFAEARWKEVKALEPIALRALSPVPSERFATAAELMEAIVHVCPPSTSLALAEWVKSTASEFLQRRQQMLASNEESWRSQLKSSPPSSQPSSGIQFIGDLTSHESPLSLSPSVSASAFELVQPKRGIGRFASWGVSAGLLLVVGVLIGLRRDVSPAPGFAAAPAAPAAALPQASIAAAVPPQVLQGVREAAREGAIEAATSSGASLTPIAKPARVVNTPSAPQPRTSPPRSSSLGTHSSPPLPPSSAPSSTSAPQSMPAVRPDCDIPFYFDGSKKIFKPNCI